jgi:transposase
MEPEKKQSKPRRKYSEEFKAGAVGLVLEEGKGVVEAARDLGMPQSVLSRWVEQARADGGKSLRGTLTSSEKEELARLRKENRTLRVERDILKKAAAFFAKENG